MRETYLTVVGRLTEDPELRFTPSGFAVVNFTIATNSSTFDKQANEWKDNEAAFWRCSAWRGLAENIAESLTKGMGVVAYGIIKPRTYETKEGDRRHVLDLDVQNIGPDLRWGSAKFTKAQREKVQRGGMAGEDPWATGNYGQGRNPGDPDPWATGNYQNGGQYANQGQGPSYDEPPF